MTPRLYWQEYVTRNGGRRTTADRLGLPYSTVASICNGYRGIGRALAERMVAADPSLDASILIWVRPVKPDTQARSQCGSATCDRAA
ncbi:hypothetical protein [Luteibacter yeojuensis]|uniref:Uncharacterized protein n=1 Tax=Luteibacter yeojuensis TaxID=345309 RepID=A0A7X5QS20_9GAMM|nr:hypothetical protein [Luteibacter yeojuensis]NID14350.1 hypothetical protein [Luteibacter yeojuensis]